MSEVLNIEVDEEFDPRPPKEPFGIRDPEGNLNLPLIGGIALAVILVLVLIMVVVKPFGSSEEQSVTTSEWQPKDPTQAINFLETYPVDDPIVRSLQKAFDDLARFYTTGDLKNVDSSFDRAGPQYALLVKNQTKVAQEPDEEGPAVVRLGPVGEVSQTDNIYVVRLIVNWTIPGKSGQDLAYDVTLLRQSDSSYLLNAIAESDPLANKAIDFCSAADIVAGLDPYADVNEELKNFSSSDQVAMVLRVIEIRVKAWEYMATATRGTSDRSSVDAIIVEYNKVLQQKEEEASSLDALFSTQNLDSLERNQKIMQDRVSSQCGIDVRDR